MNLTNIPRPQWPGFRAVLSILALLLTAGPLHAGVLQVSFDIHPTVCPNPFNPWWITRSGIVATAILGTPDLDVSNISMSGLVIVVPGGGGFEDCGGGGCGIPVPPIEVTINDVATPVVDPEECECTTDGADAFDDLYIVFDHDDITDALGGVSPGDEFEFCIQGHLNDGTPFEGCDCVYITAPLPVESSTWGKVKSGYR